jgi:hypothetical protein
MNSFKLLLSTAKLADLNHAFGLIFDLISSKLIGLAHQCIAPLFIQILTLSDLGLRHRHRPNLPIFRQKIKSLNEFNKKARPAKFNRLGFLVLNFT